MDGIALDISAAITVALLVARFCALHGISLRVMAATVVITTCLTALSDLLGHRADDVPGRILSISACAAIGCYVRQYRAQAANAPELLEHTERAQTERARASALDERTRIARELHDVPAHSLGELRIQLEVAEAMLEDGVDLPGAPHRVRRSWRLATGGLAEAKAAAVTLTVHNGPSDAAPAGGGGHGLSDVSERLALVGGRLEAGPDGDGRHLVAQVRA